MFVPFPLGKYTIIDRIRYGGMGEVLKAESLTADGTIATWAVKRPLPTVREDPDLLGLFWRETELMQKVKHRAFLDATDVGVHKGIPYLVMEYVEGATILEILQWCEDNAHSPRPEAWVLMAGDLAQAAEYLHRFKRGSRPLVHGDIRGANVMVDISGEVRLLDLGVALAEDDLYRRILRSRGEEVPPFLLDKGKSPEADTYAIGQLLVTCLGGMSRVETGNRFPKGLVEVIKRSVDRSGLYVFGTARALRREIAGYLVSGKTQKMRDELAELAAKAYAARAQSD